MKEGFVVSNRVRKSIFTAVASGIDTIGQISKKEHLQMVQAQKGLRELIDEKLIDEREGRLILTEEGEKTLQTMKKERMI